MEINISELVRPEIREIEIYQGEKYTKKCKIDLSGNESPYDLPIDLKNKITEKIMGNSLNNYPTLYSKELRKCISDYLNLNISYEQIIVGNGSDDVLGMLFSTFIKKGEVVLAAAPTFSMYRFFTKVAGGTYEHFSLRDSEFNYRSIKKMIDKLNPKIIILCSPNNPTGQILKTKTLLNILDTYSGILVIDEAYAEFAGSSFLKYINEYSNLVVTKTFSKAFGLAGIRLGYLVGSKELIQQVAKVLIPYNMNSITTLIGKLILKERELIKRRVDKIISEREKMFAILSEYKNWTVFPSSTNFIYIEGKEVKKFKNMLNNRGVKIRSFDHIPPAVRITIGKPEQNKKVEQTFREFKKGGSND